MSGFNAPRLSPSGQLQKSFVFEAGWTVKFAKPLIAANGKLQSEFSSQALLKNHAAINPCFGFTRNAAASFGADCDGLQVREVVTKNKTGSDVWATMAHRSKPYRGWLAAHGPVRRTHRKNPKGEPR